MDGKKSITISIILLLLIAGFLRFYGLMHDAPYFFDPDERNMASAITQFTLPSNPSGIISCIYTQFFSIASQPTPPQLDTASAGSRPKAGDPANGGTTTINCNLNPHFFAYGQFPLYTAYASDQLSKIPLYLINQFQPTTHNQQFTTDFPSAIFWLRFWSAITSSLTVLFIFLLTQKLLEKIHSPSPITVFHLPIIAALLAAFSPGLIQSAHFGTTESFLTLFFLLSVYFSIRLIDKPLKQITLSSYIRVHFRDILLLSLTIGLAIGSKLTGVLFLFPPLMALLLLMTKAKGKMRLKTKSVYVIAGLIILTGTVLTSLISSPYNMLDIPDFQSAVFGYEKDVAIGKYPAFYTRQFVNTTPIVFQAEKIFPYTLGWPVFILGTIGFLLSSGHLIVSLLSEVLLRIKNYELRIKGLKLRKRKINSYFFILNSSFLIFFLPNAFLFAKWTRFMTPLLPFFSIFAAFTLFLFYRAMNDFINISQNSILKIQNNIVNLKNFRFLVLILTFAFCVLSLLPGAAFMSIYARKDSRVIASEWIYKNIPDHSFILSETANVVDIPLVLPTAPNTQSAIPDYTVISFDFYHTDESPQLFSQLIFDLIKADYILVPSRRIFANYMRLPAEYPLITKYYQLLFSGTLGFEEVSEISSYPSLGSIHFPDENAEETWTVFDHPVIRIFKKTNVLSENQYLSLFRN